MKSIGLGIAAAFFFAITFVLNRSMALSGGSWAWSAVLRYVFMLPPLLLLVARSRGLRPLLAEMRARPLGWLGWSTVGFGLFYAPMTLAADYEPGWLVAGTWQITIISGALLTPLFYEQVHTASGTLRVRRKLPVKGLTFSLLILAGIAVMQLEHAQALALGPMLGGILPVVLASFAYPLGNRKMMELTGGRLGAFQRVLGMTIASMPFWLVLAVYAYGTTGWPGSSQMGQSVIIALSSGVLATGLFFHATDQVKDDMPRLAAVEATQSAEAVFAVLGEVLLLGVPLPAPLSWLGLALVVIGMLLHSRMTHRSQTVRGSLADKQPAA